MSRRNKLLKFAQIAEFPNVYENFNIENPELLRTGSVPVDMKGRWAGGHFGNDNPITLELACGRGEYTVALSRAFPNRNFIGVDIKGARIWKGAKQALEGKLNNACFLRTRIEFIDAFFAPGEVDEIWVTFPDPFPRERQVNRRLVAPIFIEKYRSILKSKGRVHLKTDNTGLFLYALEVVASDPQCEFLDQCDDVYSMNSLSKELSIPTHYERIHRGEGARIKYVSFTIG